MSTLTDGARENRSQLVFTRGRVRDVVFWQSPRTVKQARPNLALPKTRAGGLADLEIIVDTRERYSHRFTGQAVTTVSRALPCGSYDMVLGDHLAAVVERKSPDFVSSVIDGKLPRPRRRPRHPPPGRRRNREPLLRLVHERHARPAAVADDLAEYQVRRPTKPIVLLRDLKPWPRIGPTAILPPPGSGLPPNRRARTEPRPPTRCSSAPRIVPSRPLPKSAPGHRRVGLDDPDRARLRPEIWAAWHTGPVAEWARRLPIGGSSQA